MVSDYFVYFVMSISKHFQFIFDNYLNDHYYYHNIDKRKPRKLDRPTSKLIKSTIPSIINSNINTKKYKVTGSVGKGEMTLSPWIAIMDREICKNPVTGIPSAQFGYDLVYLFDRKMEKVYLTVNQGWNQYQNRIKSKKFSDKINLEKGKDLKNKSIAKIEIINNAKIMQQKLKSGQNFSPDSIDLSSKKNHYSEFYELGSVVSKCYKSDKIPSDDELIEDLLIAIGLYRELEGQIGKSVMDISGISSKPSDRNKVSLAEKEHHISKKASITGDLAEKIFKEHSNKYFDFEIKDLTDHVNYGYDFCSLDNKYCIEVKGFKKDFNNFRMTSREWITAREKQDNYFLVLVKNLDNDFNTDDIVVIKNPYKSLIGKEDVYYPPKLIEYRFKINDVF